MRGVVLAFFAIQVGLASPACAEAPVEPGRPLSAALPLFEQNHCGSFRDQADQLFCGDPELNAISARLRNATEERFSRLPNRELVVAENVEWTRDRNSSCGIFEKQNLSSVEIASIKSCLLKETEERIAILSDPNFDCLATNTTAELLICSDPSLAASNMELNEHFLGFVGKLKGEDAKQAFVEFERRSRGRDRKCDLVEKENVPLEELSSSLACLADYLSNTTAQIIAANGEPKKFFGRHQLSPLPDEDAVDLCVGQIHRANTCDVFLAINRVFEIDSEVNEQGALITAEIEMVVLSPFAVCSPVATSCTGTCWDPKSKKATSSTTPGGRDSFQVASRLRIEKAFAFQKTDTGAWRCNTPALHPVDFGTAMSSQ